jgi:phosphoglycolate phosphatase-like HAD superfamily hydrolase
LATQNLAVFDIDGTLTQTMAASDAVFARVLGEVLQCQVTERDWEDCKHVTDAGVLAHVLNTHGRSSLVYHELQVFKQRYVHALKIELLSAQPVAGAQAAIDAICAAEDWSLAIATGNWLEPAQHKLEICGLAVGGVPIATSSDSHDRTEILRLAIARSGFPERVVYLGDREWDRRAAAELGVGFIALGGHVPGAGASLDDYSNPSLLWDALRSV